MLFGRPHDSLPIGWSRRHLTFWDNNAFAINDSPTIAWVFPAGSVNFDVVSEALQRAIKRRIPWLNARVARTLTGYPTYELHVPSAECEVEAFSTSSTTIAEKLESAIAWISNDSKYGLVTGCTVQEPTLINPRVAVRSIREYVDNHLPILHLHFISASDAILLSLSWSHAVMDAVACAQLIEAWQQEIFDAESSELCLASDPTEIFDFTQNIDVPDGWHPMGWLPLFSWKAIKKFSWTFVERFHHPLVNGSIYIPSAMITRWRKTAASEMQHQDFVSSTDLISAWVFKYAYGVDHHGDLDWNTMFTAVCARGRHPALPLSMITNLAKSSVVPPMRTIDLKRQSQAQIALRLRKTLDLFSDVEYVAKFVTQEYRRNKQYNGFITAIPEGHWDARVFGITSWAKQGLGNFTVAGTKPISCLTYNAERRVATIIDTVDDWRIDLKLNTIQWSALEAQMMQENHSM